jgi:phosphate transport system substrate-binding protein
MCCCATKTANLWLLTIRPSRPPQLVPTGRSRSTRSLTEQPGKDSWPITNPTFILMHKTQDKPVNASNSLKFFDWAYVDGDKMAADLDYVPLPGSVKDLVRKLWADNIKDASGKPVLAK